jgi:hypothetical protein
LKNIIAVLFSASLLTTLSGCSDPLHDAIGRDNILATQITSIRGLITDEEVPLTCKDAVADRNGIIHDLQKIKSTPGDDTDKAIRFMKLENQYCEMMIAASISKMRARDMGGAGFRGFNRYDNYSNQYFYAAVNIRTTLKQQEREFEKYGWKITWDGNQKKSP